MMESDIVLFSAADFSVGLLILDLLNLDFDILDEASAASSGSEL